MIICSDGVWEFLSNEGKKEQFSKVLYLVSLHSKYIRALTFERKIPRLTQNKRRRGDCPKLQGGRGKGM